MTTLREAAQQALEAMEQCGLDDTHRSYEFEHAARAALRAALAQQGPWTPAKLGDALVQWVDASALAQEDDPHPPSRHCMCKACKPAFEPTPGQEQEPVAWSPALTYPNYEKERVWLNGKPRQEDVEYWSKNGNGITYVYTHPPRREWKSLTEGDIADAQDEAAIQFRKSRHGVRGQQLMPSDSPDWWLARAIEAKLKEKNA